MIVQFLLDAGAGPDALNMREQSPREIAATRGSDAVRQALGIEGEAAETP